MELNRLCLAVIMIINLVVLIQGWRCHGCLEEERVALLQIKDAFGYPNGGFLLSWGRDANCCEWKQVHCNSSTLRVVEIDLSFSRGWELGDGLLNASLFLPFPELNALYLYGNRIAGCVENEGFERLSVLGNLEILQLGQNKFNSSIFSSLGGLSSLKYLSLHDNEIEGTISMEGLNNLTSLRNLRIASNHIEGFKSLHGGEDEVLKLSNLEYLDLGGNRFDNSILSSFKGLSSLKNLDLAKNHLKGTFNMKGLETNYCSHASMAAPLAPLSSMVAAKLISSSTKVAANFFSSSTMVATKVKVGELEALSNLRKLYLSGNEIDEFVFSEGIRGFRNLSRVCLLNITANGRRISLPLLQSLAKLPNLKTLDLGNNNFEGTILAQALPSLKNLQKLDLSSSTLDNSFLQTIGRITTLKSLKLNGCRLSGNIPIAEGLCELKYLQSLDISNNNLSGVLPNCLANLTSLKQIDLSSNYFVGDISSSPLTTLTSIRELRLSDNRFQIPISLRSFFNHSELKFFFGYNNEICAELEEHNLIPKFQLERLHLSGQAYGTGALPFPKFLFYQHNLQEIYFSNMKMRGGVPNWLLENNTNLHELFLVNNSLSGPFQLPIHPHVSLSQLDISDNHLDSHIPTEIGAYFPSLTFLSMSKNHFNGSIPSSFGSMSSLQVLDLSGNTISGKLPSCFSSLPLVHVYLSQNKLRGSLEDAFHNSFELITLDLSHNQLTGNISEWIGEIPPEIGNLNHIHVLNLSNNFLIGPIPQTFSKLSEVESLDLSNNSLTGAIPPGLVQLHSLEVFSVAHNNLSGRTPDMVPQFSTFNKSSYEGNPLLCGPPLSRNCTPEEEASPLPVRTSTDDIEESGFMDADVFHVSFVVTYIVMLLVTAAILYINPNWRRAWFYFIKQSINNSY
ncbi:receptor-like protein 13 [Populus alba x Populus x berolinensis]|uniref:Receptor-like protein 13 n=1 Tax=Populus alba x Populus x berolinensis TaxID=444605 RepID=A0AAD6VYU9_9ROSI|nr:receptor-like protein 13 [Populus alba x Populus x berolinensis]